MSINVSERIAEVIVSRLQNITVANGYSLDLVSADRMNSKANEWRPRHNSAVVIQGATVPNDALTCPGNPPALAYDTTYNIHGIVLPSDRATDPKDTEVNAIEAAIKKAVANGSVHWVYMDNLAIISEFEESTPYVSEDGDNQGVIIPVKVTFRVSELDPTEVRG